MKHLALALALAGPCAFWTAAAHAAEDFVIANGTWAITAEVDGNPGRGMAVDVRDGVLVMQIYNYLPSGESTFHLTAGPMVSNRFTGELTHYRGGRYFGSGPLTAVEAGNSGQVTIDFTSSTTGTIQLPNEPPVPFSRFVFDGRPHDELPSGLYIVAELDDNQPVKTWMLMTGAETDEDGTRRSAVFGDSTDTELFANHCFYLALPDFVHCVGQLEDKEDGFSRGTVTLKLRGRLDRLEGSITTAEAPGERRLVGARLISLNGLSDVPLPSTLSSYLAYIPDPGTWVVKAENVGEPGRGMAIDVQGGTLVMQAFNYEANGDATFHLAAGPFGLETAVPLTHYRGGRYFGGPAQSGTLVGSPGQVSFYFDSPTSGLIQFPGEPAVAIERFPFGALAPDPVSLLGHWVFSNHETGETRAAHLTQVVNGEASTATGNFRCRFQATPQGTVRCLDSFRITGRGEVVTTDYRFTPGNGRAVGNSMVIGPTGGTETPAEGSLLALRVADRHGVPAGITPP